MVSNGHYVPGLEPLVPPVHAHPRQVLEVHVAEVGVAGPHVLGGQPEVMMLTRGGVGGHQRHALPRREPEVALETVHHVLRCPIVVGVTLRVSGLVGELSDLLGLVRNTVLATELKNGGLEQLEEALVSVLKQPDLENGKKYY